MAVHQRLGAADRPDQLPAGWAWPGARARGAGRLTAAIAPPARSDFLIHRHAGGWLVRGHGSGTRESPVHGPAVPGRGLGARSAVRPGVLPRLAQPADESRLA